MDWGQAISQAFESGSRASIQNLKLSNLFTQLFPDVSADVQDVDAIFTQLKTAAIAGQKDIFEALVEAEKSALVFADAQKSELTNHEPTVLMSAVMAEELEVVKALIAAGANVHKTVKDVFEFNALYFAVKRENFELAQVLIESGAQPNWTDVSKAIDHHNIELVRLLLQNAPHLKNTGFNPFTSAARLDNAEIIELLLAVDGFAGRTDFLDTALQSACTSCHTHAMKALLLAGAGNGDVEIYFLSIFAAPIVSQQLSKWLGQQVDPTAQIVEAVQVLMDSGMDLNVQGKFKTTPLSIAVSAGYSKIVNSLLLAGADPNLFGKVWGLLSRQQPDKASTVQQYLEMTSPLHLAAAFGYFEIVRTLIDFDADVTAIDSQGRTVMAVAIREGQQEIVALLKASGVQDAECRQVSVDSLMGAAKQGDVEGVQLALAAGIDPNASEQTLGRHRRDKTVLMLALEYGHIAVVKQLVASGADVNLSDRPGKKTGKTPLMYAVEDDCAEMVRFLLDAGAAVDAQDKRGQTALFYAVECKAENAVELLLASGANPHQKSWDGTPFDNAVYSSSNIAKLMIDADARKVSAESDMARAQMLDAAAFNGNVTVVRELIQQGVNVNVPEKTGEFTALMTAAAAGHETIVQLLISAGADVNSAVVSGETALSVAVYWGHVAIAQLLISAGADLNTAESGTRWTPMMKTVLLGNAEMLSVLLAAGADATMRDSQGRTVLAIAQEEKKQSLVDILLQLGVMT